MKVLGLMWQPNGSVVKFISLKSNQLCCIQILQISFYIHKTLTMFLSDADGVRLSLSVSLPPNTSFYDIKNQIYQSINLQYLVRRQNRFLFLVLRFPWRSNLRVCILR